MLRLTRKSMLAVEAVLDIAYNTQNGPVHAREVMERQGLPHRYMEQVLQQLARDGVLRGVRGPKGGYLLAKEDTDVTVGDVLRTVARVDAEPDILTRGGDLFHEVVEPMWMSLQADIYAQMDSVSMRDLIERARGLGVSSSADDRKTVGR